MEPREDNRGFFARVFCQREFAQHGLRPAIAQTNIAFEMLNYCGGDFTVLQRVDRIIDEKTGKMINLANDCIILEGVICCGNFSDKRLFCPRSIYPYWREAWLERVE